MIEVIVIFALILINGIFAMSEMALVSAKKIKLKQLAENGSKGAKQALELMSEPNRLLSAVQVGITLVGVLTGAFGGKALSLLLAEQINKIQALSAYSYGISFTIVIALITYFSLVLGELVPKRIALSDPEKLATSLSGFMTFISKIASPFVNLLSLSMNLILKILGISSKQEVVSEEEVAMLLAQATQAGVFEEAEQEIVENVFVLADRHVDAIMTPRPEIIWFKEDSDIDEIKEVIKEQPHSDYLVCKDDLDSVIGVLNLKDLLLSSDKKLTEIVSEPHFVPETLPILKLLEHFKATREHLALVVDEYGSVAGLVTARDVLEAIVGDLPDAGEKSEEDMIEKISDDEFLIDGSLSMDDFADYFELKKQPDGANVEFYTLSGFVMDRLEHIPRENESFVWDDLEFEVLKMDDKRVGKIRLNRIKS